LKRERKGWRRKLLPTRGIFYEELYEVPIKGFSEIRGSLDQLKPDTK
jgi:hypothetical protein